MGGGGGGGSFLRALLLSLMLRTECSKPCCAYKPSSKKKLFTEIFWYSRELFLFGGINCHKHQCIFHVNKIVMKCWNISIQFCIFQSHSTCIVLVDLNEFPSIFQKVQHSHSRHQKTTSTLLRINLKGKLKLHIHDKHLYGTGNSRGLFRS